MKKILKLTIPLAPLNLSLESFIDQSNLRIDGWDIQVNNPEIEEADCWFIIENVPNYDRKCRIARDNIIFLAAETAQSLTFVEEAPSIKLFMAQFGRTFTYHQYLSSKSVSSPPFLPWMINSNHGASMWQPHERDVSYFANLQVPQKNRLLSVICSTQGLTESHRMRIRFVEKLKEYFGDSLDWYGNGVATVEEKWDALADYKYTIVLENQSRYNVITEKIGDAFLAHSYPFYWGAPNIGDIYDLDGLTKIYIEDHWGSIEQIENAIDRDSFKHKQNALTKNRQITIGDFNFINRILEIAASLKGGTKFTIELHSQEEFRVHQKIPGGIEKKIVNTAHQIDIALDTNFLEIARQFYILFRYNKFTKLLQSFMRIYNADKP